jgi:endonuclease/exonuclease/phosphatase family metal-dependent hydrolase
VAPPLDPGSPARLPALRIVSFNVKRLSHRWAGGRTRAVRIGALLRTLDADVCALQEIEHVPDDAGSALALVAREAGFDAHTFTRHAPGQPRGVGLLHRGLVIETSGGLLPARPRDDKGYTRVVLQVSPSAPAIEIIAVHLDWISRRARERQAAALAEAVGRPTGPRLVVGDLNAMTARTLLRGEDHDSTVRVLASRLGVAPPRAPGVRTFPNFAPTFSLDWVLASASLAIGSVRALPTRLSDHALLVAEVTHVDVPRARALAAGAVTPTSTTP